MLHSCWPLSLTINALIINLPQISLSTILDQNQIANKGFVDPCFSPSSPRHLSGLKLAAACRKGNFARHRFGSHRRSRSASNAATLIVQA